MDEEIEIITQRPKKQKTKKVIKIAVDEEQIPYLKLQAKNIEERKAMLKKLKIFNIATQAISNNEMESDDDDFLDLKKKLMKYNMFQ